MSVAVFPFFNTDFINFVALFSFGTRNPSQSKWAKERDKNNSNR
jgi:hypothetical protein